MKLFVLLCGLLLLTSCKLCKDCKKTANPAADAAQTEETVAEPVKRPSNSTCLAWPADAEDKIPALLSQTGCFDSKNPRVPLKALIPYQVNVAFWSDAAEKKRWLALPDGSTVNWDQDGRAIFPNGAMLVKEFTLGDRLLETRFMVHHENGSWAGYTYEWNADGTEAFLVPKLGKTIEIAGGRWQFPSSKECMRCHNQGVAYTLGWDTAQINTPAAEAGGSSQIQRFQELGIVAEPLAFEPKDSPRLQSLQDSSVSIEDKARAYLHANCSFCHQPASVEPSSFDFRSKTPFAQMKICDALSEIDDLGIPEARLLKPANPDLSLLYLRVTRQDYSRMPPIGSHKLDEEGARILREWISSLSSCSRP